MLEVVEGEEAGEGGREAFILQVILVAKKGQRRKACEEEESISRKNQQKPFFVAFMAKTAFRLLLHSLCVYYLLLGKGESLYFGLNRRQRRRNTMNSKIICSACCCY